MQKILDIAQVILSLILVTTILMQHRGTGLGGAFGGGGNVYRSKRGVEKLLFNTTIVVAILFVAMAIVNLFI